MHRASRKRLRNGAALVAVSALHGAVAFLALRQLAAITLRPALGGDVSWTSVSLVPYAELTASSPTPAQSSELEILRSRLEVPGIGGDRGAPRVDPSALLAELDHPQGQVAPTSAPGGRLQGAAATPLAGTAPDTDDPWARASLFKENLRPPLGSISADAQRCWRASGRRPQVKLLVPIGPGGVPAGAIKVVIATSSATGPRDRQAEADAIQAVTRCAPYASIATAPGAYTATFPPMN